MLNLFIILLGCSNIFILNDRINSLINYVNNLEMDKYNITLYLSGGIKNPLDSSISEALIMKRNLEKYVNFNKNNFTINYVLDEKSENTAENLINAKKYLENTNNKYDKFLINTSEFHRRRTQEFIFHIDNGIDYEWILSDKYLKDSYYWEDIHIKNVQKDITNAYNRIDAYVS